MTFLNDAVCAQHWSERGCYRVSNKHPSKYLRYVCVRMRVLSRCRALIIIKELNLCYPHVPSLFQTSSKDPCAHTRTHTHRHTQTRIDTHTYRSRTNTHAHTHTHTRLLLWTHHLCLCLFSSVNCDALCRLTHTRTTHTEIHTQPTFLIPPFMPLPFRCRRTLCSLQTHAHTHNAHTQVHSHTSLLF